MKIGEKLQGLMVAKGTNANELAQRAGVPASTLYSIIKRNNTKADIDVLIRIANILGVPVEYFGEEESIWTSAGKKAFELSEAEVDVIKKYRQLSASGKKAVYTHLKFVLQEEANDSEQEEENLG